MKTDVSAVRKTHKACSKKYKPCILKYKALILKYVPYIFGLSKKLVFSKVKKPFERDAFDFKTVCLTEKAKHIKRNGIKNALKGLFLFWEFVFLVAYHENYLLIP